MTHLPLKDRNRPRSEGLTHSQNAQSAPSSLRVLLGIFLFALFIRLVSFIFLPDINSYALAPNEADSYTYHSIALNLISGNGYCEKGLEPTRNRTPTYPVFMALIYMIFGVHAIAVVVAQAILSALSCCLVYKLACRLFDKRAGIAAAFIAATYPGLIYYDSRILRESLTATLLVIIVFLATDTLKARRRSGRQFVVGLLLAVLSMCRPETILLCAPVGYLLIRPFGGFRALLKPAVLIALPVLLVWVPWTVRNYALFGTPSPITSGLGSTLWFGNRWAANGGEDQPADARKKLRDETANLWQETTEARADGMFMSKAIREIAQRPGWFAQVILKKMIYFWKDANGVKKTLPALHPSLPYMLNAYYYSLLLLVLVAMGVASRKREWVLPMFGLILSYMMIYALLHVRNRYRVPVLPLVFILSAGGISALYNMLKAYFLPTSKPQISAAYTLPNIKPRPHKELAR